jgi:hypothetical protein
VRGWLVARLKTGEGSFDCQPRKAQLYAEDDSFASKDASGDGFGWGK